MRLGAVVLGVARGPSHTFLSRRKLVSSASSRALCFRRGRVLHAQRQFERRQVRLCRRHVALQCGSDVTTQ